VALPLLRGPLFTTLNPLNNVTLPVGVPEPAVTLTVTVSVCPRRGLLDGVTENVVDVAVAE
jgi:hypothetical protein